MSRATEIFKKQFRLLSEHTNVRFHGTLIEKFDQVSKVKNDDATFSTKVQEYICEELKPAIRAGRRMETMSFYDALCLKMFQVILNGSLYQIGENNPKKHHWLPVTYLANFGSRGSNKIRATVPGVMFQNGIPFEYSLTDANFSHARAYKEGFYDLRIESAFSHIESDFSVVTKNGPMQDTLVNEIIYTVFYIFQTVRNPYTGQFVDGSFESIFNRSMKKLEEMEKTSIRIIAARSRLPFITSVPAREMKTADGIHAVYFPITPKYALSITNKKISTERAMEIVMHLRHNIIRHARRNNAAIFGVTITNISHVL